MNTQEFFDVTATHLLTQNKKSQSIKDDNVKVCKYRGPNGLKCAIGIHIPDEKYNQSLEGAGLPVKAVQIAANINQDNLIRYNLAINLQECHDLYEVIEWKGRLENIAGQYDLSSKVLDNFP